MPWWGWPPWPRGGGHAVDDRPPAAAFTVAALHRRRAGAGRGAGPGRALHRGACAHPGPRVGPGLGGGRGLRQPGQCGGRVARAGGGALGLDAVVLGAHVRGGGLPVLPGLAGAARHRHPNRRRSGPGRRAGPGVRPGGVGGTAEPQDRAVLCRVPAALHQPRGLGDGPGRGAERGVRRHRGAERLGLCAGGRGDRAEAAREPGARGARALCFGCHLHRPGRVRRALGGRVLPK